MADTPLAQLITMAAHDEALAAELRAAADPSAVVRIANRHGITLTESDLRETRELGEADVEGVAGELGEADLEGVAGGTLQLTYNPWTCQDSWLDG